LTSKRTNGRFRAERDPEEEQRVDTVLTILLKAAGEILEEDGRTGDAEGERAEGR
jgi:hypothetical protein